MFPEQDVLEKLSRYVVFKEAMKEIEIASARDRTVLMAAMMLDYQRVHL